MLTAAVILLALNSIVQQIQLHLIRRALSARPPAEIPASAPAFRKPYGRTAAQLMRKPIDFNAPPPVWDTVQQLTVEDLFGEQK